MKVSVTTEIWLTKDGAVVKAVVRRPNGTFLGETNKTKKVTAKDVVAKAYKL